MTNEPYSITAEELNAAGRGRIPAELMTTTHLIYSSPATLAFNSPGAQGFGVKRAGLSIPGSVMLLVSPGCCGRNTSLLTEMKEYRNRFFFLLMDETDLVTGRHLQKIPQAVREIVDFLPQKPSVVMICITCVDALLGTDMERVCRKASDKAGLPVLPCYMYALTREGRKPPMVFVRQSIYSLLSARKKEPATVNLLGHFAPLDDTCELYPILRSFGLTKINEISRCGSFEEYLAMGAANFNLVLNPESRLAAQDLETRLSMPYIELARLYQIDKIANQYTLFASALGTAVDDTKFRREAENAVRAFCEAHGNAVIAVGEMANANAFELSLALTRYGLSVAEIYGTPTDEDFVYIRRLAALSPATRIFTNLSPTMLHYDSSRVRLDLTIGRDACYYHPGCPNVPWSEERQPFGYEGVTKLFTEMRQALDAASSEGSGR